MVEQRVRPKRLNGRGVLTGTAVAAVLVGIFAATGVGTSLMGVAGHGTDPTYRCIADGALVVHIGGPPSGSRAASVLSLTWKAVNDEDSGFAGYWALDTYTTTLNVWHLNKGVYKGDYYWEQTFSGVFQVPQGANSPGETGVTPNNVSEPASGYGTFLGGEEGFITPSETFTAGSHPVHGNLGTINYNGTVADLLKGLRQRPDRRCEPLQLVHHLLPAEGFGQRQPQHHRVGLRLHAEHVLPDESVRGERLQQPVVQLRCGGLRGHRPRSLGGPV